MSVCSRRLPDAASDARRLVTDSLHAFRLQQPGVIDDTFVAWMREAYAVGEQRRLRSDR